MQAMLDVAIVAGSLSLWLPERGCLNRLWMWDCHCSRLTVALTAKRRCLNRLWMWNCHCNRLTMMIASTNLECDDFLYITTRAFAVLSSFRANSDINNRVILTSNLYDAHTTRRRNESSYSLDMSSQRNLLEIMTFLTGHA